MATLKSSAEYYERVASIEADLNAIARALATVEDKRKDAGLRFAEGEDVDFSAIDAEETRLTAQRKNLLAAQEQAKILCEQARDAEKEQHERQKVSGMALCGRRSSAPRRKSTKPRVNSSPGCTNAVR